MLMQFCSDDPVECEEQFNYTDRALNGTWRSLVAHLLGVQEVAGSNPVVPTNFS